MTELETIYPRFKEYLLEEKGLSSKTTKQYLRYLERFGEPFPNKENVYKFLIKDTQNNGVARSLIIIYSRFLNRYFNRNINIDLLLPEKTKKRKKLPIIISEEEVFAIGRKIKEFSENKERDVLLLLLSFYGGLRLNELINLRTTDFLWDKWAIDPTKPGELHLSGEFTKGGKDRVVFLRPAVMKRVYTYAKQVPTDELFNIGKRRWQMILRKAALESIKKSIHPHTLRHSFATYMIENGMRVEQLRDILGHEDLSTTGIYLHISKENLKRSYAKIFTEEEKDKEISKD